MYVTLRMSMMLSSKAIIRIIVVETIQGLIFSLFGICSSLELNHTRTKAYSVPIPTREGIVYGT